MQSSFEPNRKTTKSKQDSFEKYKEKQNKKKNKRSDNKEIY